MKPIFRTLDNGVGETEAVYYVLSKELEICCPMTSESGTVSIHLVNSRCYQEEL